MTFQLDPALVSRKAHYDFFVANWPERLQRASQRERELLALMAHPCYRLLVRTDEDGLDRLVVRPSPGMPSPVTNEARAHIRTYRSDLIAFVRQRDATTKKLQEVGL